MEPAGGFSCTDTENSYKSASQCWVKVPAADETEATLKVINRGICLLLGAASELGRVIVLTSFLFLLSPFCDLELGPCTSTHCCQSQG